MENLITRLEGKERELKLYKQSYLVDTKNIDDPLYEKNAINMLMVMMQLKSEIQELKMCIDLRNVEEMDLK